MMLPPVRGYVVWLLLSKRDRNAIKYWQNILREEFTSPEFEPHLTLIRPVEQENEDRLIRELNAFSDGRGPLELEISGINGIGSPYQSFYLDIKLSGVLDNFRQQLAISLNSVHGNSFNPHISLLYGEMTDSDRRYLRTIIDINEYKSITGDALALVLCNGTPDTWRIISRIKLAGQTRFV
jgi:2'-5' RNA ligase